MASAVVKPRKRQISSTAVYFNEICPTPIRYQHAVRAVLVKPTAVPAAVDLLHLEQSLEVGGGVDAGRSAADDAHGEGEGVAGHVDALAAAVLEDAGKAVSCFGGYGEEAAEEATKIMSMDERRGERRRTKGTLLQAHSSAYHGRRPDAEGRILPNRKSARARDPVH